MKKNINQKNINRRQFMTGLGASVFGLSAIGSVTYKRGFTEGFFSTPAFSEGIAPKTPLQASAARAQLLLKPRGQTTIWGFNGTTPGPVIRTRQGAEFSARFVNNLPSPATIHWHGLRIPNELDGVPDLTQKPVESGQNFDYHFSPKDAGTYFYYGVSGSQDQRHLGLYGAFIVEEHVPPQVDLDIPLVLDDWVLNQKGEYGTLEQLAQRSSGFETVTTLNGEPYLSIAVKSGMRLRLRFINASSSAIFTPVIDDYKPTVIAIDGQPVTPFQKDWSALLLIPGQRMDVVIDTMLKPGSFSGIKLISGDYEYLCGRLVYDKVEQVRDEPLQSLVTLPPNPMRTNLDLAQAVKAKVMLRGARERIKKSEDKKTLGKTVFAEKPVVSVNRGQTVQFELINKTKTGQIVHCHGHHVKEIKHSKREAEPFWRDTLLINVGETVTVAFVADNPGKWQIANSLLSGDYEGVFDWFEVLPPK